MQPTQCSLKPNSREIEYFALSTLVLVHIGSQISEDLIRNWLNEQQQATTSDNNDARSEKKTITFKDYLSQPHGCSWSFSIREVEFDCARPLRTSSQLLSPSQVWQEQGHPLLLLFLLFLTPLLSVCHPRTVQITTVAPARRR